jgi:hypothetical protein
LIAILFTVVIKITAGFFIAIIKLFLKFIWNRKETRIAKTILKKRIKNMEESIT